MDSTFNFEFAGDRPDESYEADHMTTDDAGNAILVNHDADGSPDGIVAIVSMIGMTKLTKDWPADRPLPEEIA